MPRNVKTNIVEVNDKLAKMSDAMQGRVLEIAIRAGLLPIETRAKVIVHKITTTLARSLHTETASSGNSASGRMGTDVEYALREEFLGGGGHAYMRPAFDAEKDAAVVETADTLREIVGKSAS